MLKINFKTILAIGVVGVFGYVFYTNFGNVWADLYIRFFPCRGEIAYSLGSFDSKFNISKEDFLEAVAQAEMIWEKPMGREFFTYNAGNDPVSLFVNSVVINLVYDDRQEATERIRALGLAVSDTRASYDSLRVEYKTLEQEYLKVKSVYKERIDVFTKRQEEYKKKVNYWNSRGGAPEGVYRELSAEGQYLEKEFSQIRKEESDINKRVDDMNALVTVINNLAKILNINARELNTIGESRGEEFTEGEFKSDGFSREINVYEFSTKDKLIRLLAHELGHALGLPHVDDPEAIMYYLNENENGKLTQADLFALKTHCKIK